ncbi:MAG: copper amine oxidase N-terminal domain-containing protein [Syntrophomonadaceae bacterium]|nr:copper amine oxidase N-terminal domain-containing protein [Syntrophomonadaceae bacterium]
MRYLLSVVLVLMFIFLIPASVCASGEDVLVFVDGKKVESDVPATIVNGSTMLPFRSILNALGITDDQITWREKSKSIEVVTDNTYIFLVVGSKGALINNNMIMIVEPFITKGRTMVPVRFISEAFGASVKWDGNTRTVSITTKNNL